MSISVEKNYSLKNKTSLKVGGDAEYFFQPKSYDELGQALLWAKENNTALTLLGGGTNTLISDDGVKGLVLQLSQLNECSEEIKNNKLYVRAMSGFKKHDLMRVFLKHKLSPSLFLSGLPGEVGGGIFMNAGISEDRTPREFCEVVNWFEVMRLNSNSEVEIIKYQKGEIEWSYRKTKGWQPGIIINAEFVWPNEPDENIVQKVKEANSLRLSKQPLNLPSCGSVFKNPEGTSAGRLIDECGLKGFFVGGAEVSKKHANFISNVNNACASDIHKIITHVKDTVKEKKNIDLHSEVIYLGKW